MSYATTTHPDAHPADHHPSGMMRWLTTTNHKDIGTMYLTFSLIMFFVGGLMILAVRAELFQPGLQLMKPEFFNQLIGVHALVMIFAALMPAATGFANWMLPLMIGAPDMALPRLNNWGFWLLPPAAILLTLPFTLALFGIGDGAIATGWTFYAPRAVRRRSSRWQWGSISPSSRYTSSASRRSWARSTSSSPSSTCGLRA